MATRTPTNEERATFGADVKIGADDKPIETGRGSQFNAAPNQLGIPGWKSKQDVMEGK